MGLFGKSDDTPRTVKASGKSTWQDERRLKLHGSAANRGMHESQGKLMRMTDRPGRMQGRRP